MGQSKTKQNSQTADDILASLLEDLKEVDKTSVQNDFGLELKSDSEVAATVENSDHELPANLQFDKTAVQLSKNETVSAYESTRVTQAEPTMVGTVSMMEGLLPAHQIASQSSDSHSSLDVKDAIAKVSDQVDSGLNEFKSSMEGFEIKLAPLVDESAEPLPHVATIDPVPPASQNQPNIFSEVDQVPVAESDKTLNLNLNFGTPKTDSALNIFQSSEDSSEKTQVLKTELTRSEVSISDRTVAVADFSQRPKENLDEKVKISVGQSRGNAYSSGYAAWGNPDSGLAQAEHLKMAQEKILELERENEKLRLQNIELLSASDVVKERADLLNQQIQEYKGDRDQLENSYKNETQILKNQLARKEAELQKSLMKIDEFESRLKFDMKKIRVRERELENRLELIRAEKNALVKNKDEQILDLRRKLDQMQLEIESYRQKCVELNKVIDTNQESFKRTTRALRLAMANLELQEENKIPLKKAE